MVCQAAVCVIVYVLRLGVSLVTDTMQACASTHSCGYMQCCCKVHTPCHACHTGKVCSWCVRLACAGLHEGLYTGAMPSQDLPWVCGLVGYVGETAAVCHAS